MIADNGCYNQIKPKPEILNYMKCPGCGYKITERCYDRLIIALNCRGCGEYTTDAFIEFNKIK